MTFPGTEQASPAIGLEPPRFVARPGCDGQRLGEALRPTRSRRLVPHYISADTAPAGLAVRRPVWVAPASLASFAGLCAATVLSLPRLETWYVARLAALTGVPPTDILVPGTSLSFRPFMGLLMLLLAVFSVGPALQRLRLLVSSWALYGAGILVLDALLAKAGPSWIPSPLSPVGGIAAAWTGVLVVLITIFTHRRLPRGVKVTTRRGPSRTNFFVLPACTGIALGIVSAFSYTRSRFFGGLRLRFIGWIQGEVVLFFLAMICLLLVVSAFDRRSKPARGRPLPVAFLVPAHNEAHAIAECIRGLDAAAANYRGPCAVYVVNNASSDGTRDVAVAALAGCQSLTGQVLECATPGKAKALNFGLSRIREDVVVRIDADTVVAPSLLEVVVPWFWDRNVGGVGGFPLPKRIKPRWLYSLQLIELYYAIAFFRVAQSALDGITVMPGSIAAYRRRLLEELGGFGQGFNGEDSDITMRIGRLGYRIVTDAGVRVRTEVPETLGQLREQRQRWTRGRFHMAARNLSSISMRQGIRGLWMLPYSIINASRRCLMIPLVVSALAVETVDPSVLSLREISAMVRLLVVFQVVAAGALLVAQREFAALPFAPLTLLYRLFLAYIAFETLLTLRLKPGPRRRRRAVAASVAAFPEPAPCQGRAPLLFDPMTVERQMTALSQMS